MGPVFLCAAPCQQGGGSELPHILTTSPRYLLRGYDERDRIVYGTGTIVRSQDLLRDARWLFKDPRVRYQHVRSAQNNCFQLRIERA